MRQLIFVIVILLSIGLNGQDFTINLEHPTRNNNYEFFTFPNPETNEIYAVAFHLLNVNNSDSSNILWTFNTKTNTKKQASIPNFLVNDIREVRNMFYYENHIFCLKHINNNETLVLQPLAIEGKAKNKALLISLKDDNDQYLASQHVENNFYVFTVSRKERLFKIYKLDLNKALIDVMKIDMPREDILTFRSGNLRDERYYTKVIDPKDFNHPHQVLVNNKIYFEKNKIVLLQDSPFFNQGNIIYQIDFEAKKFERRVLKFPNSIAGFNSTYHNNHIYRFSGSNANMTIERISLSGDNKIVRHVSDRSMNILPFQTSSAKQISFNRQSETPILANYRSGKFFKKPLLGYITLGLIEEQDDVSVYLIYSLSPTDLGQSDCDIHGLSIPPNRLNYYFIETNLSPTSNASYDPINFKIPYFATITAKCQNEGVQVMNLGPTMQRFLVKNEVAGVEIHRLEDGFYGSYFNRRNNEFGFKKLVDIE